MSSSRRDTHPGIGSRERAVPDLSLDHVDAPGAEGLHAVVNVHNALTFCHVQHHIQNDIATCAASARAGEKAAPSQVRALGWELQTKERR